jgi:hypothetical protein
VSHERHRPGLVLDRVADAYGDAAGLVAAMWLAVALIIVGAVLLVPVREPRAAVPVLAVADEDAA